MERPEAHLEEGHAESRMVLSAANFARQWIGVLGSEKVPVRCIR